VKNDPHIDPTCAAWKGIPRPSAQRVNIVTNFAAAAGADGLIVTVRTERDVEDAIKAIVKLG